MIEQASIESELKQIENNVLQFKSAQPFYNGQLGMKLVTNQSAYDTTVTVSSSGVISGNIIYISNSQPIPYCNLYAVLKVSGNPVSVSQASTYREYRVPYGQNNEVQYHFKFNTTLAAGTVIQVKGYAIASDYGTITAVLWS